MSHTTTIDHPPERAQEKRPLARFLAALGLTQFEATISMRARGVRIGASTVSRLCAGSVEPSPRLARAIVTWSEQVLRPAGVEPLRFSGLIDTGEGA